MINIFSLGILHLKENHTNYKAQYTQVEESFQMKASAWDGNNTMVLFGTCAKGLSN